MTIRLEAVYENGSFRPLTRVELPNNQHVTLIVEPLGEPSAEDRAKFALLPEQWENFFQALEVPPNVIPALRDLLTEPSVFDDRARTKS